MKNTMENSQAVQTHLKITQNVIQRIAGNSTSSKAWCITLVSAILVIVVDKNAPQHALIAIIPAVLFLTLDAYYLTLEKMFRNSYDSFIAKLHKGEVEKSDLYTVKPTGNFVGTFLTSLLSFSIWPFYLTLVMMVIIIKKIVL